MSNFYRFLSSPKIRFLDDILNQLEKEPVEQNEDSVADIVCFNRPENKIGLNYRINKPFIPDGKERKYFRIAVLYLEREKLITSLYISTGNPSYIINYEGIVLVKSGGLGRKLILEKWTGWLQRLAWFIVFFTFLVNTLIQLNLLRPFDFSNNEETKYPNELPGKQQERIERQSLKSLPTKTKVLSDSLS